METNGKKFEMKRNFEGSELNGERKGKIVLFTIRKHKVEIQFQLNKTARFGFDLGAKQ